MDEVNKALLNELLACLSSLLKVEEQLGRLSGGIVVPGCIYVSACPNKGDSDEEEALGEMEKFQTKLFANKIAYKPMFRNHPDRDRLDAVAIPL